MNQQEIAQRLQEKGRRTPAAEESSQEFTPPLMQPSPGQVRERVSQERAEKRLGGNVPTGEDTDADKARERVRSLSEERRQKISQVRSNEELTPEAKAERTRAIEVEYSS